MTSSTCSECQLDKRVLVAMAAGRDGKSYQLCVKCYLFKSPARAMLDEPALPPEKLSWKGGAHYVPDVVLD